MQGMADGLALLIRAYELDPTNVATLNMLAHYCLLRGQYDKASTRDTLVTLGMHRRSLMYRLRFLD
jgi:hypothetical protein